MWLSFMLEKKSRTEGERILDMATAAAAFHEPFRRQAIMGLMHDRFRWIPSAADPRADQPLCCTEAEVFYAGYGDETGSEYWKDWLSGDLTVELARILAAHTSRSAEEFDHVRNTLAPALAPIARRPTREMVEHLIANPDTRRFVPASLRAFLEITSSPASVASATPATAQEEIVVVDVSVGRPTSMDLIEIEFARRHAAGLTRETKLAESKYLSAWLKQTHPKEPQLGFKALSDNIKDIWHKMYPDGRKNHVFPKTGS
jgi:hypothetical protein